MNMFRIFLSLSVVELQPGMQPQHIPSPERTPAEEMPAILMYVLTIASCWFADPLSNQGCP